MGERWVKVPLAELVSAEKDGPLMVYRDSWWVTTTDGCALLFKGKSPQCNRNRAIIDRVLSEPADGKPELSAPTFLPFAYLRFNMSDYQ